LPGAVTTEPPGQRVVPDSPYRGLTPFSERDAPLFFGRDSDTRIIAANLAASRLTVLYGASGVGKSSVLRAGVVPSLTRQAQRNLEELERPEHVVVVFPPDPEPDGTVAHTWAGDPMVGIKHAIRSSIDGLGPLRVKPRRSRRETEDAWADEFGDLLIMLDQFEEYFLYHGDDDHEHGFAATFAEIVDTPDVRVNFLLSIREDAYFKLLDHFQGWLGEPLDNVLRIEHLDRASASSAIVDPVRRFAELTRQKIDVEDKLVEDVLDELTDLEQALGGADARPETATRRIEAPLLQLVMTRIWDEERTLRSPKLRAKTLARLKGAGNIWKTHLDRAMEALPHEKADLAARVFRYLVTPSGAKIALRRSDLADWLDVPETQLAPLLDKLCANDVRILRPVVAAGGGAVGYEIFHDVLAPAVLDWRVRHDEDAHRREVGREERAKWKARYTRWVIAMLAVAFMVTTALAIYAIVQRDRANRNAAVAVANGRAAEAAAQPERALQLAVEAMKSADTPDAEAALRIALAQPEVLRSFAHHGAVNSAALSPDGKLVLTASADGSARLSDRRTGKRAALLRHGSGVNEAAFSPDGRLVVTVGADATAKVWDKLTGNPKPLATFKGHTALVNTGAFSPDGKVIVTASDDGTARLWTVHPVKSIAILHGHTGHVNRAAFSRDGSLVVTASDDGTARLWDRRTGRPVALIRPGGAGAVLAAAFSPHGNQVYTASDDGIPRIWDARTRKLVTILVGGGGPVTGGDFSPNGELVVTVGGDKTARVWDIRSGQVIAQLTGHSDVVNAAAFDRTGRLVVTASDDGTARVWEWEAQPTVAVLDLRPAVVNAVAFSPDGRTVAAGAENTVEVWDLKTRRRIAVLRGHSDLVTGVAFSPNGTLIASASADGAIRLWDAHSHRASGPIGAAGSPQASARGVGAVAFSPDGKLVAAASGEKTRLWDVRRMRLVTALQGHDAVTAVAFSPDGMLLATGAEDGTSRLWDLDSRRSSRLAGDHGDFVSGVAFSPDGALLATAGADMTARLWDVKTHHSVATLRGHTDALNSVAFSPDGSLLQSASNDGTIRLWDVGVARPVAILRRDQVVSAVFDPNGRHIAIAGSDGTVRVQTCGDVCGSIDELLQRARDRLARQTPVEGR
jgi:WD40 repeat protein